MLVLLSSGVGLGGSATNAAETLTWDAVHRAKAGDIGSASLLIEILMPLATSDPDDMARLAWYKLIQAIIEKSPVGLDQIMLMVLLLALANRYDNLRPPALTILRTLISTSLVAVASQSSQIDTPARSIKPLYWLIFPSSLPPNTWSFPQKMKLRKGQTEHL